MQTRLTTETLATIRPKLRLLGRLDRDETELMELIDEIVNLPDPEVARVLYMKYVDGYSWARIGIEFHQPPDAIRMHCKRRLKEMERDA